MCISRHADRCHSSAQALKQLLSVQRAVLEQSDEILDGVLHTLFLLGSLHTTTITADAQRTGRSAARRPWKRMPRLEAARRIDPEPGGRRLEGPAGRAAAARQLRRLVGRRASGARRFDASRTAT